MAAIADCPLPIAVSLSRSLCDTESADQARARVRDLKEEALRVFRSRVVNPKWLASIRRHGYKGGLELAATVDYLFGYDATADVLEDWVYERVTEAYVQDKQMREFLRRSNPWAMRDIAGRLLEAAGRGLWAEASEAARAALEQAYLEFDAEIEGRDEGIAEGSAVRWGRGIRS